MPKSTDRSADAKMPSRPVQHRLEARSRVAFSAHAPETWSVEDRNRDYGIDLDVEIFEGDQATGLRFAVQLKSVGDFKGKPSVSVKAEKLRYWLAQDVPVLLCLWDSGSNQMWVRWAHHIDPTPIRDGAKSVGVRFVPEEEWTDGLSASLEREVLAARAIRDQRDKLPIQVNCVGTGTIAGVPAGLVVVRVREALRRFSGIFRTSPRPSVLAINIKMSSQRTMVELSGGSPKTLDYSGERDPSDSRGQMERVEGLAADILFVVATQLHQARLTAEGAAVLESVAETSPSLHGAGLAHGVTILARGGKREAAIGVLDRARRYEATRDHAGMIAMLLDRPLDSAEGDLVVDVMREWATSDLAQGDLSSAAILTYNLARRSLGSAPEFAVKMFEQAAMIDPSYRDRDYWRRDLGGALFLSGEYAKSADEYARAVALGDQSAELLYADALLFAGRYTESLDLLQKTLSSDDLEDSEYRLKARYVQFLVDSTGITRQSRDDFVAERMCDVDDLSVTVAGEALQYDLLCPMALWRLAAERESAGARSVEYFLAAVFSEPSNAVAWVSALAVVAGDAPEWWADVAYCARKFAGDGVVDLAWEMDPEAAQHIQLTFESMPDAPVGDSEARITTFGSAKYERVSWKR
ncbi:DUF4365 domain-containing protein [Cellulomonas sp. NPDC055163]